MKILMISSNFKPGKMGGADYSVLRLTKALITKGHIVEVLTYGNKPYSIEEIQVNTISQPLDTPGRLGFSIPSIISIFNLIHIFQLYSYFKNFELIHIHNTHSLSLTFYIILMAKIMKKPIIWTTHDYWFICPNGSLLKNDLRICEKYDCTEDCYSHLSFIKKINFKRRHLTKLYRYVDKVISPSQAVRKTLLDFGINETKIDVIPFGIDITNLPKLEKNHNSRILYVGYIDNRKGCNILIRSMLKVRDVIPDIKLYIVGSGPKKAEFINLVSELDLKNNITFFGRISEDKLNELYAASDCIVVPSIWPEVFGLIGLEAMNFGKPVIGSNIGGIPDWLDDKITGFLVEPGNADQIAEKIIQILSDDKLSELLSSNAREKLLREFNIESYVENMENAYCDILKAKN